MWSSDTPFHVGGVSSVAVVEPPAFIRYEVRYSRRSLNCIPIIPSFSAYAVLLLTCRQVALRCAEIVAGRDLFLDF